MFLISIKKVLAKVWLLKNAYIFNFEIYGNLSWQDHYFEGEIILTDITSYTNNNKLSQKKIKCSSATYLLLDSSYWKTLPKFTSLAQQKKTKTKKQTKKKSATYWAVSHVVLGTLLA